VRFLADECCPAPVVAALRGLGHDVTHVLERNPGASDEWVANEAMREDRIVITEDYDFGEMVIRRGLALPGVALMAMGALAPSERAARLIDVIRTAPEMMQHALAIVEPARVRARPFEGSRQ